jgi:response regulator RpfG family c-di-GMP phosphodiesterase
MTEIRLPIYLVDDDDDDRVLFEDALKEINHEVELIALKDGEELMDVLDKNVPPAPYIIFLDLNMPRKNGFECLTEIKRSSKLKDIPIIVFSTAIQQDAIKRAYLNGANHYICKPNTFVLLKKVISQVFSMSWPQSQKIPFDKFLLEP